MPLFRDPLLAVWEAMNLLSKVDACPDSPQIRALIANAETVLCRLTMELARRQRPQNKYASEDNKIEPIIFRFNGRRARKLETS